nr:MAG TPA: hypothetical protein [Caudoviricetes sp.]
MHRPSNIYNLLSIKVLSDSCKLTLYQFDRQITLLCNLGIAGLSGHGHFFASVR